MSIYRWFPGLDSFVHYQKGWLGLDIKAGLSVAAIQIPTAIAYAQIAGFPAQVGLYACILPMLIYALIGSSRQLMVGPDAATAAMVAAAITPLAAGDPQRLIELSMIVAIMVGLLSIIAGISRTGFIASFLSRPILVGYLNGIGLSLLVGQLGKLFGYETATSGFIAGLLVLWEHIGSIHWLTFALGFTSLLLMILLPKRYPQLPGALTGVILATVVTAVFGLDRFGIETLGVLPAGLPQLRWPTTDLLELQSLLRDAFGITVVSFCSAMLTARSFAARHGESINANHELISLGIANIGAGISQGFVISGADSRTAVNDMSGGKTQLVGIVAALVIAATLLLFYKPMGWVPMPALGAVLLLAGYGLIDIKALRGFWRLSHFEFGLCVLTTIGVLGVGVLPGIFVAVLIAVLRLLYYTYRPYDAVMGWVDGIDGQVEISKYPQAKTMEGLIIYRFDAPLLFFNADYFKQRLLDIVEQSDHPKAVLLNGEGITSLDITGLAALHEVQQILHSKGVHLSLARITGQMLDLLQRSNLLGPVKPPLVFSSVRSGISAFQYWKKHQESPAPKTADSNEAAAATEQADNPSPSPSKK